VSKFLDFLMKDEKNLCTKVFVFSTWSTFPRDCNDASPKAGFRISRKIIALFVSWFLADLDLHEYLSDVPTISPSVTTLKEIMVEEAIYTMFFE